VARKVTVAQLLTHTSGLADRPADLDRALRSERPLTVGELLAPFRGDALKSEPGTRLQYSNLGYLLLGALIEKASGQDYFSYMRERVFVPANMASSGFLELDRDPPRVATGYADAPGGERRSNAFFLPVRGAPFTCAYATAGDLVRFAEALRSGRLLGGGALKSLWTGRVDYTEPGGRYGYGCVVKNYNGVRIVAHGGGWVGITDRFEIYPDLGYTVAILTNIDSAPNPIAFKLREWLTQGRLATDAPRVERVPTPVQASPK
jgi:D-alanyl-D-alanine carboxypeptidase